MEEQQQQKQEATSWLDSMFMDPFLGCAYEPETSIENKPPPRKLPPLNEPNQNPHLSISHTDEVVNIYFDFNDTEWTKHDVHIDIDDLHHILSISNINKAKTSFQRKLHLPKYLSTKESKAKFADGFVVITFKKIMNLEEAKPRKVPLE